jgi:hypothetical protein
LKTSSRSGYENSDIETVLIAKTTVKSNEITVKTNIIAESSIFGNLFDEELFNINPEKPTINDAETPAAPISVNALLCLVRIF